MSVTKRIKGDYNIISQDSGDNVNITTDTLTLNGNLVITGDATEVETTNLAITDQTIVINKGESGAGITGDVAGIEIERGSADNVGLRYDDSVDAWMLTQDGSTWLYVATAAVPVVSMMQNLVEDTTPQLGGDLDVNGFTITSASDGDIIIDPNGTGELIINHEVSLEEQVGDPGATGGYNKLYSKTAGDGGSGIYFQNSSETDELVSRRRSIVHGIIF